MKKPNFSHLPKPLIRLIMLIIIAAPLGILIGLILGFLTKQ